MCFYFQGNLLRLLACMLSHVRLFVTPWTVARQAPLSLGILQTRILEWVVMPPSRVFPTQGSNLCLLHLPALAGVLYHSCHLGSPHILQKEPILLTPWFWTGLQNCKTILCCCFKPSHVWYFAMPALGNLYMWGDCSGRSENWHVKGASTWSVTLEECGTCRHGAFQLLVKRTFYSPDSRGGMGCVLKETHFSTPLLIWP